MATIKIQGNPSGSGSVTLAAPNTNSARTVTFPDEDIDLGALGGAGNVQAWASLDGGGTVSVRGGGNVSSITDYDVGSYGVSFSSAISSSTYAANITSQIPTSSHGIMIGLYNSSALAGGGTKYTPSTTSLRFATADRLNYSRDPEYMALSVIL